MLQVSHGTATNFVVNLIASFVGNLRERNDKVYDKAYGSVAQKERPLTPGPERTRLRMIVVNNPYGAPGFQTGELH